MRQGYQPKKNAEGYPDPTAAEALASYQRSQRAMHSKRSGEYFEAIISSSLNWYADKGLALVEKTPEPMKPLSRPNKKGQFLACFTKAAQPDFKGTLKGGRSIVFEAKHTDDDRIEDKRVTKEQADRLQLHHSLGALSFVLVSFGLDDFYRVPWEVWREMKAIYGRKYITRQELEMFRVQYISGILKILPELETRTPGSPPTGSMPIHSRPREVAITHAHDTQKGADI